MPQMVEGKLELTHSLYFGEGRVDIRVPARYAATPSGKTIEFILRYDEFLIERAHGIDEDFARELMHLFEPELEKVLWNKATNQLFPRAVEKRYVKE